MKLKTKILIPIIAILVLSFAFINFIQVDYANNAVKDIMKLMDDKNIGRAQVLAYMIAENQSLLEYDEKGFNYKLAELAEVFGVDEIHIIDEHGVLRWGNIQSFYGYDFRSSDQSRKLLSVLTNSESIAQEPQPRGADGVMFQYISVPRIDRQGIVQIGVSMESVEEIKSAMDYRGVIILTGIFTLLFVVIIIVWLTFAALTKPLKKLMDGVSRLGLGNLDVSIDVNTKDELGLLAKTFNKMAVDLKKAINEKAGERAKKEHFASEVRDVLTKAAKSPALSSGDYVSVAKFLALESSHVMNVTRVEIWKVTDFKAGLKNLATYDVPGGGYVTRAEFDLPDCEEYENMLKTERLVTTNNAKTRETLLKSRDAYSAKTIASLEAPIWMNGELAGIICIEQEPCDMYPRFREWTTEEDSFIVSLADIMALVISNNERWIIMQDANRLATELDVATQIQASMLPCIFPAFPDRTEFDVHAGMTPAKEVGGDFYDFFLIDENTLAVVIADVSDTGVPAALFMVVAKTLIKNNAQSGKSPKEVFETVNNLLCENNGVGMFVTAFLGYLDIPAGKFTFVNAGHNPPLTRINGEFGRLKAKSGFILAGMENMVYKQHEIILNPGDELFLYTDGITEAENNKNELFGNSRLLETVNNHLDLPLKEFTEYIKQEIDKFADGAEQSDDITMLALRYNGKVKTKCIEAKIENLDAVLNFINAELEAINCPVKASAQIAVAVEEIFVNIAHYAYNPETGTVNVKCRITGNPLSVNIEFSDSGKPYNPLEKPDIDTTLSAEKREIGGLGILIVKKSMTTVKYEHRDGKNILTINKEL